MIRPGSHGSLDPAPPIVSVVLTTFNRVARLRRAVASVQRQCFPSFELVVVDDGSTDGTPAFCEGIVDRRVVIVRQANAGICRAKNAGLWKASGEWVVFLDDDDALAPEALASFAEAMGERVGAISGAAAYYSPHGVLLRVTEPAALGAHVHGQPWTVMPGAFLVRRECLVRVGGFRPHLAWCHHTDLIWRVSDALQDMKLAVRATRKPVVLVERAAPLERPLRTSANLLAGTLDLLTYHRERLERCPAIRARFLAVAGRAAMSAGDRRRARSLLWESWRLDPACPGHVMRLLLPLLPPRVLKALEMRGGRQRDTTVDTEAASSIGGDHFVSRRYRVNRQVSFDAESAGYWSRGAASMNEAHQVPVYRLAAQMIRRDGIRRVADLGCGTGAKLLALSAGHPVTILGIDQTSAIALASRREAARDVRWLAGNLEADGGIWVAVAELNPRLVISADVIEHLDDPGAFLRRVRACVSEGAHVLISTPDRERIDGGRSDGPPTNPRHVREWTTEEFRALALAAGFRVDDVRHLFPRRYALSRYEVKRCIWRLLHARAVPDRRSCMVFVLAPAGPFG